MQRQDKALLVVSFGTTHDETREKTIGAIERDLAARFPQRRLYRGLTSRVIAAHLKERGLQADALEEALARMQEDGMADILVQPTHLMTGAENDRMLAALAEAPAAFAQIRTGRPLLADQEDRMDLAEILAEELLTGADAEALVLMGHGSAKKPGANRLYDQMQEAFRASGRENIFVGTVEGTPSFEDVLRQLMQMEKRPAAVTAAPLMIVAGDHAKNDMAGESEDSWKRRLEEAGFEVRPVLKGLGEYPGVREMIVRHAAEAERIR